MKIDGVGCGPGLLTQEALEVIRSASLVYGSDRAIAICRQHLPSSCIVRTIDDFKALDKLPAEAVVLSTGDPMLAGLGYLKGDVVPGISSLQVAAARLRIPIARIVPVVAHGKGHERGVEAVIEELNRGRIAFLIADPAFDLAGLYQRISLLSQPITIAVCENLGYPDERIASGPVTSPPFPSGPLAAVMIGVF
jgi:cobalt-precorrin-7 (C5)-methyltransferase